MKYSKIETLKFAAQINKNQCLKDLNLLIINEGYINPTSTFTNDEIVLDMDCIEHKIASKEKRTLFKSMDSSCIIADVDVTTKEILLVEFRFNYSNMRNLDKKDLFGKVLGSETALQNPSNIHSKYYFIFNSNLKQQAIRRFRNMNPTMPNNYIATDINELKELYF